MEFAAVTAYRHDELHDLRRFFNSDSSSDWFQGLQLIAAWQLRSSSTLPSFIYLTEMILKARLNHSVCESDSSASQWYKDENMRHFDSLMIIRFVNIIYELAQARHQRLLTVREAALEFGIPEWIVQLRHASTHSPLMPDGWLCRSAMIFLSDWLKENFWNKCKVTGAKIKGSRRLKNSTLAVKKIGVLLNVYLKVYERNLNKELIPKTGKSLKLDKFSTKIVHAVRTRTDVFLSAFVDRLILTERKMNHSNWNLSDKYPPQALREYWHNLFSIVKQSGKIAHLLKMLSDKFVQSKLEHEQVQAKAWMLHLLDGKWLGKSSDALCVKQVLRNFVRVYPIEREDKQLLRDSLQRISKYLPTGMEKLTSFASLFDSESLKIDDNMVDEWIKVPLLEPSIDSYPLKTQNGVANPINPWRIDLENTSLWNILPFGATLGANGTSASLNLSKPIVPQDESQNIAIVETGN